MPSEARTYRFIDDGPTADDRFGPHRRIAKAIARLVTGGESQGRCVALTGPWGSGKSSVILQLQEELKNSGAETDVFLFDAWIHQGDPLRRCFLERLIEFAKRPGTDWDAEWRRDLDVMTGRREITRARQEKPTSWLAAAIAISLLVCIPVAGAYLGKASAAAFWTDRYAWIAMALYAIPALLLIVAWRQGWSNVAASVIRDLRQDTETETVRTREASSIDFRTLFGKIAAAILGNGRRRLVIVIDNLDRIDAANAVSMWTTMRAFFDFGEEEWNRRVWLVVPFDRTALTKLWTSPAANGADLTGSFLEKTFQVVFHLSPPLLTALEAYFRSQMQLAFEDGVVTQYFESVYRLHSLLGPPSPSPRQVKSFLNRLRAQALLWMDAGIDSVPLPFLAVLVLKVDALVEDSGVLIQEDFLSADAVNVLAQCAPDKDWRQQIAAAHFGVPPEEALQMLLYDLLSKAFQSGDFKPLEEVRKQPYFWAVFRRHVDAQHRAWLANPTLLASAILFAGESRDLMPANYARELWADLLNKMCQGAAWEPLDSRRLQAIKTAIGGPSVNPAAVERVFRRTLVSISTVGAIPIAQWVGLLQEVLFGLGFEVAEDVAVGLDDPSQFVQAQLEILRQIPDSRAWRHVRTAPGATLTAAFAAAVIEMKDQGQFPVLRQHIAEASGASYASLNHAVLQDASFDLNTKLDLLMPRPAPPEAELSADSLGRIAELAGGATSDPRVLAAGIVLDSGYLEDAEHLDIGKTEQVAAVMSVLLSWRRYGAVAAAYPRIREKNPQAANAVLQAVAARSNLVEDLLGAADVLRTPAECAFYSDLLPQVPAGNREAVTAVLAWGFLTHGIQPADGIELARELVRHQGAAWLPDSAIAALQRSPFPELPAALERRTQIAGRSVWDLLDEAEAASGWNLPVVVALIEDAIRAGLITGAGSAQDVPIARAAIRQAVLAQAAWATARPEVDAVEAACRPVRDAHPAHVPSRILLGRTLLLRARMSNDLDAPPLLREAFDLLVEHSAWPAAQAAARLSRLVPKAEALSLLERAGAAPNGTHSARASIELLLARAHFEDDTAAAGRFRDALQIDPQGDDPQALCLRARILLSRAGRQAEAESRKSLTEARKVLQTALGLEPDNYEARILNAEAAVQQSLWNDAEESLRAAIAIDPDRPKAHIGLMNVAEGRAEQDDGGRRAQLLDEARKPAAAEMPRFEAFAQFRRRLGRLAAAQARLPGRAHDAAPGLEAAQHFEAAAALMPGDPYILENWGYLLLFQGRQANSETLLAAAIGRFRQALEVRPGYKWALTGWAEALAALDGGPVEKEIENCEAAIAKHGEALQADPAFRTALVGRDAVQVRLSWLRPRTEAASLLDEAAKDLALVLAANDADAWAHQVMGRARYALAERAAQGWEPTLLEAALANFRRAAELRKDEPDYRNDIGDALRAQAKFAEALQSYQSVPQEAGRAYARALVGVGLTQLGRTDAALQRTMETVGKWVADGRVHFGDAIRLDPGNYIAHRGLGAILGRLAELHPKTAGELLEEAGYHLQEALKARPGDAVTLTGLGDLYRAQAALPDIGSDSRWTLLGKASEQYAAAIAALPDHFAAWLGSARTAVALSGIAARRDMLAKAVEHYEQALAARPKHAAARKELEEVRKRLEQERPTAAQA